MKQMAEKKRNESFQVVAEMGFRETFRASIRIWMVSVSVCFDRKSITSMP